LGFCWQKNTSQLSTERVGEKQKLTQTKICHGFSPEFAVMMDITILMRQNKVEKERWIRTMNYRIGGRRRGEGDLT
jgi:hypothetical protein